MSGVYIQGVNAYLPERSISIAEAVIAGKYETRRAEVDGFSSVRCETSRTSAEMAVQAAMPLLRPRNSRQDEIDTLYLASIHRHGHKLLWPAASFVQDRLRLSSAVRTVGISQGCNGAFIAASLAYDLIGSGRAGDHLVIGADRFSGSAFDRFNSDLGTLYGDAAAALRLSPKPGWGKVLCCFLESEARLEEMYRDQEAGAEGPADHAIKDAKRSYLDRVGREHFDKLFNGALNRLRDRVNDEVDLRAQKARYVVFPNVGAGLSAALYQKAFGEMAHENLWAYGRSVGHTGTADQFIGLDHIVRNNLVAPGERVLLVGAGNGLSLAAMVIERLP